MTFPRSTSTTNPHELLLAKYRRYNAKRVRNYERENFKRGNSSSLPFIGVDGEGGGQDEEKRQNYLLMCCGDRELFNENRRLTTEQCLNFLLAAPAKAILCGYFFTYDATQILRDLPEERLRRLYSDVPAHEPGTSPYTFWKGYAIEFRPRQFFRVAALDRTSLKVIPGTARTVNEVGGFFQKSFVEAIKSFKVGDESVVDMIAGMKDKRAGFDLMTEDERKYCAAECDLLAQLMEKFRVVCGASSIVPAAWRGAGWISARIHSMHGTPKKQEEGRSAALRNTSISAYFGGRFEAAAIGRIPGPVYVYDIRSAYPSSMLALPCPIHTAWKKIPNGYKPPEGETFAAKVTFKNKPGSFLGNLPIRIKGRLFWPLEGTGSYWSPELISAQNAGTEVTIRSGYRAEKKCQCKPHDWVNELYEARRRIGSSTMGYPIKLGLNGLYGKYAQRQGAAPYRDYIAAGMITAITRSRLIDAYASDPSAVIYLATDAIFSRRPLPVDLGEGLGQWEEVIRPDGIFVVQPGLYWSPGTDAGLKTRGIPRSQIIAHRDEFEDAWCAWLAAPPSAPPFVKVPVTCFIGHRQALAWGRLDTAGSWMVLGDGGRGISFDWRQKRAADIERAGYSIITAPIPGHAGLASQPYDENLLTDLDDQGLLDEARQDWEPWGNSGE